MSKSPISWILAILMNVYGMHSAWRIAVINKCQVCAVVYPCFGSTDVMGCCGGWVARGPTRKGENFLTQGLLMHSEQIVNGGVGH